MATFAFIFPLSYAHGEESAFQNKAKCYQDVDAMTKKDLEEFISQDEKKTCQKNSKYSKANFKHGKNMAINNSLKMTVGACEITIKTGKETLMELRTRALSVCDKVDAQMQAAGCNTGSAECGKNVFKIAHDGLVEQNTYVKAAIENFKNLKTENQKVINQQKADLDCLNKNKQLYNPSATSFPQCNIMPGDLDLIGVNGVISTSKPKTISEYYSTLSGTENLMSEQTKAIAFADNITKKLSSISEDNQLKINNLSSMMKTSDDNIQKGSPINKGAAMSAASSSISAAQAFMGNKSASTKSSVGAETATASIGDSQDSISSGTSGASTAKDNNTTSEDTKIGGNDYLARKKMAEENAKNFGNSDNNVFSSNNLGGAAAGISEGAKASMAKGGAPAGELGQGQGENKTASKSETSADSAGKGNLLNMAAGGGGSSNEFSGGGSSARREKESDTTDPNADIASVLSKMKSMFDLDETPSSQTGQAPRGAMSAQEQVLGAMYDPNEASQASGAVAAGDSTARSIASDKDLMDISLFTRIRKVHRKSLQKGLIHFDSRIRI